jgi:hypothetical protein
MPSPKATKEPEPGEPMSERPRSYDAVLRGSQQRPDMQPGCLMGTLYGGPVRAPRRGGGGEERYRWVGWKHWCSASCRA